MHTTSDAVAPPLSALLVSALAVSFAMGCGGPTSGGGGGTTTAAAAPAAPRPGGPVDLVALVPGNAVVVLHANMNYVRQDPARYDRIAGELATELGLSAEHATLRELLDHTDDAIGVFGPAGADGHEEGMLVFAGRYSADDFDHALAIAGSRHGSTPEPEAASDGRRVYALGDATIARLDQWTWAVAKGPSMRAHLLALSLAGPRAFSRNLLEFGPRIGLPQGSTQAWADQDAPVGAAMVGLVFQGENPQMVHNFVGTVRGHLGL